MYWDLILWIIALISNIALLAILLYQVICLSDLEADYMNPYESSSKINSVVVPEFILQGAVCALFLVTGHRFMFLVTLPLSVYHARLFAKRAHLLDVTEIFRALSNEKKYRIIKLGVYLCFITLVIVRLVLSLYNSLADEDEAVHGIWLY
ncbi:protein cornichon homolog 1 isoform X2 [Silene latifolia]|uniref:protein cornichon homolog 1 isoform X2 n=1 Tax=Silene latifolia TaxID=37657 RepID=UPI003D77AAB0